MTRDPQYSTELVKYLGKAELDAWIWNTTDTPGCYKTDLDILVRRTAFGNAIERLPDAKLTKEERELARNILIVRRRECPS